MKTILKFSLRIFAAVTLTSSLIGMYFAPGSWSFVFARFAVSILVYEVLRFAFETKVADLVFKGVKVGEHREEE